MSHHGGVRPGAGKGKPSGQSSTVRDRRRLFEPHDQSAIHPPRGGWVPGAKQTSESDSSSSATTSARVLSSSPSPASSGRNSASGQSSPGPPLMIDETGQKEREMLDASSLQGQSDDSLQDDSLFQQLSSLEEQNQKLQQKIVETEKEKERLKAILDSQDGARNCYSPDIGPGGKVLPSRVLDGRAVLERDRLDSAESGGVREEHQHVSFGDHSTTPSPLERRVDPDKDLLAQVRSLLKERKHLESRLRDMKENNHTLQREVAVQHDSIAKTRDQANDLKKDVDLLRSENSKLISTLRKTEKERDGLQVEKQELQGKFSVCENKLMQVEKFYLEAEHQNQSLEEELAAIVKSRDHLSEEKQKLDQEVHNALKTKDNFRQTIRKLREQNTSLETKMSNILREKEVMEKREEHMKREEQYKEAKLQEVRMEMQGLKSETKVLKEKLSLVEREKSTLMAKCEQIDVSEHQLKQQLEETKWEREELKQRLANISQNERRLHERQDKVLKEIESCSKELRQKFPGVKSDEKSSPVRHSASGWGTSSGVPAEITSLKALHADIISEAAIVQDQRKLLEVKVSQIESLLQTREEELNKVDEERRKLRGELSAQHAKWKEELRKLEVEWQEKVNNAQQLQESLGKERDKLLSEMCSLQERINEISVQNKELAQSKGQLEAQLSQKECVLAATQKQLARLMVEKACSTAQLTVSLAQGSTTEKGEPGESEPATTIADTSAEIKQLSSQITVLTKERDDLRQQLQDLNDKHSSTLLEYRQCAETNSKWSLETEKVKLQYSTDLRILQSKVDKLEADKANLEKKIADMESKQPAGSAFQPVHIPTSQSTHPRKVTFDPLQEKSQQQIMELQHKVTMLEAENKRLQDLTYGNTSSIEVENSLRRKLLQMRRENIRLDTRRKQLEERVSNLQSSLKAAKETHERSTHERIKTMQEENSALQDRIRSMEDMLSRKNIEADTRMNVVVKENDILRHKLSHLHNGLETVEGLLVSVDNMSSLLQRQDQILAILKSELEWKSDGDPAATLAGSLDKIMDLHSEVQTVLTTQTTQEIPGKAATLGHHATGIGQALPPVLQQLPAEYVSNLQGKGSRSRSTSVSAPILQVREKVSQLHLENLAINQIIRKQLETRRLGEKEVTELGQKLSSLQQEVRTGMKQLQEAHKQLAALHNSDLSPEQLNCIFTLEKQVETWQDKVIDRDMALRDIEIQMREDFESHDQKFSLLKSQLLALQEELSSKGELLLARDQFIQETEERCVNAESEVVKLRKEMERAMQEVLNVPEGFQLSSHNRNISELVRAQNEEMQRINGIYQEQVFQLNQLRGKLDAIHRENSILQHQNLEAEKHHQQICQELHTERDYLRQINLQLIEQQVKAEDASDLVKMIKRSQEVLREQRDIHKLRVELDASQVKMREQELRINELQHQLYAYEQQNLSMKLMQAHSAVPPEVMVMPQYKQQFSHMQARHTGHRPRSASAADSVPRNYKTLRGYNDLKARNRTQAPQALEGDFTIPFPSTSYGENILNLNDQSDSGCKPGQYVVGLPVVTDDEGANTVTETEDASPKHQRSKLRRHRRTASTGSNSFPDPASIEQDTNTKTPMNFNPTSATLPISMSKPRTGGKMFKRPVSAGSTQLDLQEKIGQYAQNIKDKIEEMTNHHEENEEQSSQPMEDAASTHPAVPQGKGSEVPLAAKSELKPQPQSRPRRVIGLPGITAPWFIKGRGNRDKSANKSSTEVTAATSTSNTGSDGTHPETLAKSVKNLQPGLSNLSMDHGSFLSMKADDASSNGGSSAQVSRMSSLASRSDSFASSASTTFSGVGGESSPYSTLSNDSLLADSIESLQHLNLTSTGPPELRIFPRGPYSTPIVTQPYIMSSSSDEEGRYGGSARPVKRSTLERAQPVNSFRPLNLPTHHRTTSSCDSDILQPSPATTSYSHITIPLCRNESISLSDMEKYSTDHEDVQERISYLQNKLSKTRRSSTGSITIFNSGSSMEDINKSGD